jgi:CheY-like chemotaxis protein
MAGAARALRFGLAARDARGGVGRSRIMTSSPTILLLDDEPMLRRASALLLSNRGGRVTEALSPDDAVELAADQLYDVVIVDLSQPGARPADVLARMRAEGLAPRRSIAMLAEGADARDAEGFDEVLRKPYAFDRLLRFAFTAGGRKRTRSGVFARAKAGAARAPAATPTPAPSTRSTQPRAPRRAARAGRGRG